MLDDDAFPMDGPFFDAWYPVWLDGPELGGTTVIKINWPPRVIYHSKVLDRFRRMHVYTPPGYDSGEKSYPVFHLLHGATDSDDKSPH